MTDMWAWGLGGHYGQIIEELILAALIWASLAYESPDALYGLYSLCLIALNIWTESE